MRPVIVALDLAVVVLRAATGTLLAVGAVLAALAWGVRSRRIQPFGAIGRFVRQGVDPLLAPLDRRLVRFGIGGASVPWWGLLAVLLAGASAILVVSFVRDLLVSLALAGSAGPRGVLLLAVRGTFATLQLALLVRVLMSWVGGHGSAVGRLAARLTEWFLAPLRRALPPIGGAVDISPIVAWFLLSLVEGLAVRVL